MPLNNVSNTSNWLFWVEESSNESLSKPKDSNVGATIENDWSVCNSAGQPISHAAKSDSVGTRMGEISWSRLIITVALRKNIQKAYLYLIPLILRRIAAESLLKAVSNSG